MLTLPDMAKAAFANNELLRATAMSTLAQSSPILATMPFANVDAGDKRLRIAGGTLDVDAFLIQQFGMGTRAQHESMKLRHLGSYVAAKMINGDTEAEPREYDGVMRRVASHQTLDNGGEPLTIAALDGLINTVSDNRNRQLWMSEAMRRTVRKIAPEFAITSEPDVFGRLHYRYKGLLIVVEGGDVSVNPPLAFNEEHDTTSIYCVAVGEGFVHGIQRSPAEVRDCGLVEDDKVYRTEIEWWMGYEVCTPESLGRLRGIAKAPVAVAA